MDTNAPKFHHGSAQAVYDAIRWRVRNQHLNEVLQFGIDKVMDAIEETASHYESRELDEIGSSDISCWVKDMFDGLRRQYPNAQPRNVF